MDKMVSSLRDHVIQAPPNEPIYHPSVAATLAGLSLEELERACEEGLITPKVRADGSVGYTRKDIYQLTRIRRLREDLGLDWDALATVLHLRAQVLRMRREIYLLQRLLALQEEEFLKALQTWI
ncbi:MAG: MerR family transcriptional regulator [Chloroflexi bacterium]|nr:MerR family transcriptional regulator [Chloroflexota bacterium]